MEEFHTRWASFLWGLYTQHQTLNLGYLLFTLAKKILLWIRWRKNRKKDIEKEGEIKRMSEKRGTEVSKKGKNYFITFLCQISVYIWKIIVARQVKIFPSLYGTLIFITFARANHWVLTWASWIQSTLYTLLLKYQFWYYSPIEV